MDYFSCALHLFYTQRANYRFIGAYQLLMLIFDVNDDVINDIEYEYYCKNNSIDSVMCIVLRFFLHNAADLSLGNEIYSLLLDSKSAVCLSVQPRHRHSAAAAAAA